MLTNIIFSVIFIISVYYLIQYRLNLKKAADIAEKALFPRSEEEYRGILIPIEWKEMLPLSKHTKSYQYVKWGTVLALILLSIVLYMIVTTDLIGSSFFSLSYIFFAILNAIKHQGNLYILPKGLILNGKYFSSTNIKYYEVEKIIRWHELYGLDDRVNNAYKLTFKVKNQLFQPNCFVIEKSEDLDKIHGLLERQKIPRYTTKVSASSTSDVPTKP